MSELQTLKTAIHEIAHAKLHDIDLNAPKEEKEILKCLWADTCKFFECPELCEIFCLCDHIVFGNIKGLVFERSRTLGMNGEKCDFCFMNGKGKNR